MRRSLIGLVVVVAALAAAERALADACSDDNPCTLADHCEAGTCVSSVPVRCPDDGNPCTKSTCNVGTGMCESAPTDCDDNNPCTTDSCSPTDGCTHMQLADDTPCDGGNSCIEAHCTAGVCIVAALTSSCDDGNACTSGDTCMNGSCVGTPLTGDSCTVSDACTMSAHCVGGLCFPATFKTCPVSADPCLPQVCNPMNGECVTFDVNEFCARTAPPCKKQSCSGGICQLTPDEEFCDDGNACTVNDTCVDQVCVGEAVSTAADTGLIPAPVASATTLMVTGAGLLVAGVATILRVRRKR